MDHDVQSVALLEQLYGSGKDIRIFWSLELMRDWEVES